MPCDHTKRSIRSRSTVRSDKHFVSVAGMTYQGMPITRGISFSLVLRLALRLYIKNRCESAFCESERYGERIALLSLRHSIKRNVVEGHGMAQESDWQHDHKLRESQPKIRARMQRQCQCLAHALVVDVVTTRKGRGVRRKRSQRKH